MLTISHDHLILWPLIFILPRSLFLLYRSTNLDHYFCQLQIPYPPNYFISIQILWSFHFLCSQISGDQDSFRNSFRLKRHYLWLKIALFCHLVRNQLSHHFHIPFQFYFMMVLLRSFLFFLIHSLLLFLFRAYPNLHVFNFYRFPPSKHVPLAMNPQLFHVNQYTVLGSASF